VLSGSPGPGAGSAAVTYLELLRVIETYVQGSQNGAAAAPSPLAHTFVVPVHQARSGQPLTDRYWPELSRHLRGQLTDYFGSRGQPELADRLAQAPGPFLVSVLEPALVPADPRAPRMLVDLSGIGAEFMYSVVDAYDRPIDAGAAAGAESLDAIRGRLLAMIPSRDVDETAAAAPPGQWVYLLDGRQLSLVPGMPSEVPGESPALGPVRYAALAGPRPTVDALQRRAGAAGLR
jgi:hypothetical protein